MPAEQRPLLNMMPHAYAIRHWPELFETADSRERVAPNEWVKMRTKHDGRSYRRVTRLRNANNVLLGWYLSLQVAAKMPARGLLADLDGPLDAKDLADKTGIAPAVFQAALTSLIEPDIGWIERLDWDSKMGFWENVERLCLTPPYIKRQREQARRRALQRDSKREEPVPRSARLTASNGHTPRGAAIHSDSAGLRRAEESRVEDSRRENLSFSPDRELSSDELRSLLIDLTKKSFAGAPLTSADFQNREKDLWLEQALPITFAGVDALRWFYTLPVSHEVFKTTARVQSAEQLLRKLKNEVGKALTLRPQFAEPAPSPAKKEPPDWREFFRARYGEECRLPATFWDLGPDLREEWDLEHKEVA